TSMARSDWRPSMRGLIGMGEMIGMAGTMPDFVHGLNLFLCGDYIFDIPGYTQKKSGIDP
ncbi:hypothetical protein, partial [Mesorhizobium sp. M7D.F.Ca.US.004.03.1.1]|uniref:hypothetical protein n=1 Tax=Mesorhizobium sp. M7D.F.Ca.US.004.03.1.1 TaxID=2496702 RepID=UPI0019D25911